MCGYLNIRFQGLIGDACGRIALYGLIVFYALTKEELQGKRPLAKFLSIKLIVMFTFYQGLVVRSSSVRVTLFLKGLLQFDALEGRVIHGTLHLLYR